MKELAGILLAALIGVVLVCAFCSGAPVQADEETELQMTLEKISAPFDAKAKVQVQQKDGKFKDYSPKDYKKFDKEVDDNDLEIIEIHIKDRKIQKLVFGKKLKDKT